MHDSKVVANRFLELAKEAGDALTPMQVLKLVYIAHGWMLGLYGRPLIRDEIQAWQYGPVIPYLYDSMKRFRSSPVEGRLSVKGEDLTLEEDDVVRQVYQVYGSHSGPALSRLTHQLGSPWEVTYKPGVFGVEISNDVIEDHYARLAQKGESAN